MAQVQDPTFWGGNIAFWIQTLVFFISALFAIYTLRRNEAQAKKRATVDLVLSETQDMYFRDIKEKFGKYKKQGMNFTKLACEELADNPEENDVIMTILNHYEFIASGIFEKALDEEIYKRMKKGILVRDWKTLEPYVMELRRKENRKAIYAETQRLAEKWEKDKGPSSKFWRR
ncbi:TPA: DUF4760 domain-containing protein [Acinetobacter baumannii]|nr:DUF4760 domain-containing protein [Acinetobacter baumannii]HAV5629576.1 DUF4760 domain-containing protein [Acinetobacter baumannii]HAV5641574.1 DUF4760 domain-containing protein [Acinetobacter baumannii]HAV5649128.1 DUF4760 domain-containing protein [Acinetobacter baumannii]HAV5653126.1 DUF4760 domain-containing protein [Acinetobacter baumannii]